VIIIQQYISIHPHMKEETVHVGQLKWILLLVSSQKQNIISILTNIMATTAEQFNLINFILVSLHLSTRKVYFINLTINIFIYKDYLFVTETVQLITYFLCANEWNQKTIG
jgi:hypothetical protein